MTILVGRTHVTLKRPTVIQEVNDWYSVTLSYTIISSLVGTVVLGEPFERL